jgi:small nuclear ribonucleoprotein (snRNP)-like protein
MKQTGIQNMRAYLLKMALNGYIVQVDLSDVREFVFLLKNISNNINQVAKRANETRNIYESDVQELCRNFDKIWDNVNDILQKLAKI